MTEGPVAFAGGSITAQANEGVTRPITVSRANHGQYVSGAAKAGVKGAALAAIAKDKSLVGPYTG